MEWESLTKTQMKQLKYARSAPQDIISTKTTNVNLFLKTVPLPIELASAKNAISDFTWIKMVIAYLFLMIAHKETCKVIVLNAYKISISIRTTIVFLIRQTVQMQIKWVTALIVYQIFI